MSSLALTIPVTLLLAAVLLGLVVRAVRRGEFDDWEGPAARHYLDADGCPERDAERDHDEASTQDGAARRLRRHVGPGRPES